MSHFPIHCSFLSSAIADLPPTYRAFFSLTLISVTDDLDCDDRYFPVWRSRHTFSGVSGKS